MEKLAGLNCAVRSIQVHEVILSETFIHKMIMTMIMIKIMIMTRTMTTTTIMMIMIMIMIIAMAIAIAIAMALIMIVIIITTVSLTISAEIHLLLDNSDSPPQKSTGNIFAKLISLFKVETT